MTYQISFKFRTYPKIILICHSERPQGATPYLRSVQVRISFATRIVLENEILRRFAPQNDRIHSGSLYGFFL